MHLNRKCPLTDFDKKVNTLYSPALTELANFEPHKKLHLYNLRLLRVEDVM